MSVAPEGGIIQADSLLARVRAERYGAPPRMAIQRVRASAVCVLQDHLLVVRLRDPASGRILHFIPGGAVEPGERPADTAVREVLEETGLDVVVDERSELIGCYPFVWGGQAYDVTTHFYKAAPLRAFAGLPALAPAGMLTPYQLAALWVPRAEVEALLSFDQTIWRLTSALLS